MDGRGVPLSIIVTGANRHDVSQVEAVLAAIMVKRPSPAKRRHKHLCADAGDTGAPALRLIEAHGYIPHVKGRGQEAGELKRDPTKKARRWIVEVAHSWFNRFRKLLVRYEKLDQCCSCQRLRVSGSLTRMPRTCRYCEPASPSHAAG